MVQVRVAGNLPLTAAPEETGSPEALGPTPRRDSDRRRIEKAKGTTSEVAGQAEDVEGSPS